MGNEAVDQLTKFDRALRDFSSASGTSKERGIDGMIVTKWDTVDDKVRRITRRSPCCRLVACDLMIHTQVGAALSMAYVTGQPIVFVGCGQVSKLFSLHYLTERSAHFGIGQTYTDLRQLRVSNVVQAILSD